MGPAPNAYAIQKQSAKMVAGVGFEPTRLTEKLMRLPQHQY